MSYQGAITKQLSRMGLTNGTRNPDDRDNKGSFLGEAFMWDEAKKFCDRQSKIAWQKMNDVELVPSKDELRQVPDSESEIVRSPSFACLAKVSLPRKAFSQEECMNRLSKKYKIDKHELVKLFKECYVEGNPSVSLKIVERA